MLHTALLGAGDGKGDRTPTTIRKEARLQDALDSISVEQGQGRVLEMNGVVPSLTISQEDFDLLLNYTERAGWVPRVARDAVDLWDWLSTAPKQD